MKIYVASSWRNIYQPEVVRICREAGHEPYDFRNPGPGDNGFGWSEIDPAWQSWDYERYRKLLAHPRAEQGFGLDMGALKACDACLLVYPCGKSAHLETPEAPKPPRCSRATRWWWTSARPTATARPVMTTGATCQASCARPSSPN